MTPKISINDAIPNGVLAGYNAEGRVVCCLEIGAEMKFVMGSHIEKAQVLEWQVSAAQQKRFLWQQEWTNRGFPCVDGVV